MLQWPLLMAGANNSSVSRRWKSIRRGSMISPRRNALNIPDGMKPIVRAVAQRPERTALIVSPFINFPTLSFGSKTQYKKVTGVNSTYSAKSASEIVALKRAVWDKWGLALKRAVWDMCGTLFFLSSQFSFPSRGADDDRSALMPVVHRWNQLPPDSSRRPPPVPWRDSGNQLKLANNSN